MPETLWRVECKFKPGAGIRGAAWSEHAVFTSEGEAKRYVHAAYLKAAAGERYYPNYWFRAVPMKIHVKYKGPAKLPNAVKGLQQAFQLARKMDEENNTGFNGQFIPRKDGSLVIRLGGAR